MDTRAKFLAVALVGAIVGFMLQPNSPIGQAIWPPHDGGAEPTSVQLPLLVIVSVVEALAFGAGIAFLLFGRPLLENAPGATKGWATAAYVAIAWGLVSWVPHTSMHISSAPGDFGRLILIEYLFHVTLVAAAAVTAAFFWRVLGQGGRGVSVKEPARKVAAPPAR